jgi:hypothetical protein
MGLIRGVFRVKFSWLREYEGNWARNMIDVVFNEYM